MARLNANDCGGMDMDFRKAFFPTEEEKEAQRKLLEDIEHEGIQQFIDKGMTQDEAKIAYEEHLHYWYSNEARGYYG